MSFRFFFFERKVATTSSTTIGNLLLNLTSLFKIILKLTLTQFVFFFFQLKSSDGRGVAMLVRDQHDVIVNKSLGSR